MGTTYLYGTNAVLAALSSKRRSFKRLMMSSAGADKRILHAATASGVAAELSHDRHSLNQYSDNRPHNGVVLECGSLPIESRSALGDVRGSAQPGFVILLDEVSDPQNLGSIIRSAHFLGCQAIVLSERNCSPVTATVAKVSSGACEYLPIFTTASATGFLRESRRNGWKTVAAASPSGADSDVDEQFLETESICLVLGSEGYGIRTMVRRECSRTMGVCPAADVAPVVDSLNVGAAAAILIARVVASRKQIP